MVASATEGRRERKKRELRARIYETARQLFFKHGFEATTVEQIAEAADIAQATFFNHFQNKQAVLSELTSEVFDHLQSLIDQQLARSVSAQERIAGFADSVANDVEQSRGLAHDVLLELMRTSAHGGEAVPYLSRLKAPFTAIICQGQEQDEVRVDLEATFMAEIVLGALNAAIINWVNDAGYPLEERLRQMAVFLGQAIEPCAAPSASGSPSSA
jgi:AcrR family transcriptional regulator